MILLIDNDIILKLASCDLLAEAAEVFGITLFDFYVLPSARFKLLNPKKPNRAKVKLQQVEYARLEQFFKVAKNINLVPNPEVFAALTGHDGIDEGESLLFSALGQLTDSLLATGDKRSLIELQNTSGVPLTALRNQVRQRTFCFEQIVMRIIQNVDFNTCLSKIVPARNCDTALRFIFSKEYSTTQNESLEGLTSYINDLRMQTGDLLMQ